jgi:hypothetical protein
MEYIIKIVLRKTKIKDETKEKDNNKLK